MSKTVVKYRGERKMNKLQTAVLTVCKYIVFPIFGFLAVYFFVISLFGSCAIAYTDEHVFYLKDFPVLMLTGLTVLILLLAFLRYKVDAGVWDKIISKRVLVVITVIWFIMLVGWIHVTLMIPAYDQYDVFNAAKELIQKDYSRWEYGMYMYDCPHQNAMVLCYVPFHLLFPNNTIFAIEVFNLICWFGAICGLSRLAHQYFQNVKIARIVYLGLLFFFPAWGYITFLYGNIPALLCCVWAISFERQYEDSGKMKYGVFMALCLLVAIMWKQNSYIWAIGICIMLFMDVVRKKRKESILVILMVAGFLIAECISIPILMQRITGHETNHGYPALSFVAVGLNESNIAPGWYNEFFVKMGREKGYIKEEMNKASIEEIKNRLQIFTDDPEYGVRFFGRKLYAMWSSPDFEGTLLINRRNYEGDLPYWVKDIIYNGGIANTVLFLIEDIMQSVYTFGIILYLIFDRKKLDLRKACPMILLIGGFIFHFFWEGKTQYSFPYYIMLFPYAVKGFYSITLYLKSKWEKHERKYWKDGEIRIMGALLALIMVIGISDSTFVNSTIKLGVDTADYIYYCQNEIQWKHQDYHRSDDLEELIRMNNLKYELE